MRAKKFLEELERRCREEGVKLIYDELRGEGGLCRLHSRYYIIVNRRASTETRIRVIQAALERLEEWRRSRPGKEAAAEPQPAAEAQTKDPSRV